MTCGRNVNRNVTHYKNTPHMAPPTDLHSLQPTSEQPGNANCKLHTMKILIRMEKKVRKKQ